MQCKNVIFSHEAIKLAYIMKTKDLDEIVITLVQKRYVLIKMTEKG